MKPRYRQFSFDSYHFDPRSKQLELHYSYDDQLHLSERFRFNFPFANYNQEALDHACFGLFIMAGISYYKAYLAPQITIKQGGLTSTQADFFDHIYRHGLGELYVQNGLVPPERIEFPVDSAASPSPVATPTSGAIVPIAGGKDSLVSAELLREAGQPFDTWTLSHTNLLQPLLDRVIGEEHLAVERVLDPQVARNQLPKAYQGHVPFSAIVGFAALVSAILAGRRDLVLSNEASAGEINLKYHGLQVNHQYSKTLEFERMLQSYIAENVTPSVRYFSFLRPLSELRIAELFCRRWLEKYQGLFTSCNRNFKQENDQPLRWCGECPKCAFIFLIFSPFISKEKLVQLFHGHNLFEEPKLESTFRELLGIQGHKPFDCVGEVRECRQAVVMARATGDYPELDRFQFPPFIFDYQVLQRHAMPTEYYRLIESASTPRSN